MLEMLTTQEMFLQNLWVCVSSALPKGLAISKKGYLTNYVEKNIPWEADSLSDSQVTPRLLWNPDIHNRLLRKKKSFWTSS
jgi:hypothetical protein